MATLTLNLPEREAEVLEKLASDKDMSKTAVLRQALRLYQFVSHRAAQGERLFFEGDDRRRKEFFMGGLE